MSVPVPSKTMPNGKYQSNKLKHFTCITRLVSYLKGHKLHLIKFWKLGTEACLKPQQQDANLLPPAQQCLEKKPDSFPANGHHRQDAVSPPDGPHLPSSRRTQSNRKLHGPPIPWPPGASQSQRAASTTNGRSWRPPGTVQSSLFPRAAACVPEAGLSGVQSMG